MLTELGRMTAVSEWVEFYISLETGHFEDELSRQSLALVLKAFVYRQNISRWLESVTSAISTYCLIIGFADWLFQLFACSILLSVCMFYIFLFFSIVSAVVANKGCICVNKICIFMLCWYCMHRYYSSHWEWSQFCICTSTSCCCNNCISNSRSFSGAKNIIIWSLFFTTDSCSQISSQSSCFRCLFHWCSKTGITKTTCSVWFRNLPLYIFCLHLIFDNSQPTNVFIVFIVLYILYFLTGILLNLQNINITRYYNYGLCS